MKRIFTCVLLMFLLFVPFASSEVVDPMDRVKALMDVDAILLAHKSVAVNRIYYDYEGNELFSAFLYAGADADGRQLFVSEDSEGNVEILSESGCVGLDTWSMKMYMMGFVMDEYEENILQMKQNFFADMRLNEKFFSEEMKDGARVITTKTYYQGDYEGECEVVEYIVDEESGKLIEIYEYFEDEAGERILNSRAFVTMDMEYEINPVLSSIFETENTRNVYIHLPDGTQTLFTPPVDTELTIIYPEEYVLYEDEMKTRMYAGEEADENGIYPEDTHLYLDVFG